MKRGPDVRQRSRQPGRSLPGDHRALGHIDLVPSGPPWAVPAGRKSRGSGPSLAARRRRRRTAGRARRGRCDSRTRTTARERARPGARPVGSRAGQRRSRRGTADLLPGAGRAHRSGLSRQGLRPRPRLGPAATQHGAAVQVRQGRRAAHHGARPPGGLDQCRAGPAADPAHREHLRDRSRAAHPAA
jgi:hypothetical protein